MFNKSREKVGEADARADEARRWSTIGGTEHRRSTMGTGTTNDGNVEVRLHWVVVLYLSPNNQHRQVARRVSSRVQVERYVPPVFLPSIPLFDAFPQCAMC